MNELNELKELIKALCRIPAPSGREDARAAFCRAWLEENGGSGVYIDEAKNVICPVGVTEACDLVIFMAHMDTVFPDSEPMPMEERGGRLYCPGIGDDTANIAILMMTAKYFLQSGAKPKCGILFVADSCEEGLGNLAGCRALMQRYGARVREVISFDLGSDSVFTRAVGSARWRISLRTAGGHSFGDFGNRSAIHAAAQLIDALYRQPLPQGGTVTYNVGTIEGGTSVNTIAEHAALTYEYRSDSAACMAQMEQSLRAILAQVKDTEIGLELLGLRPGMGESRDSARHEALIRRAETVLESVTGVRPARKMASTDCNIPLSMGIPSVCFGLIAGGGAHTRGEYLELSSLPSGLAACRQFIAAYFIPAPEPR